MKGDQLLVDAIENLYSIFSRYPLRKHVDGCPCCVGKTNQKLLESKPLRQLTAADLGRYSFKAMTTWGNKNDFRHFLPRIFELLLTNHGLGWGEEVILGKLALAEWTQWPDDEQTAVRRFLSAAWGSILSGTNPHIDPDSLLCGMSKAGEDLKPYLDEWTNARNTIAYDRLSEFLEWHEPTCIKRHSLNNPYWPDLPAGVAQICNWLINPATRQHLENILLEHANADLRPPWRGLLNT